MYDRETTMANILVVEDEVDICNLIRTELEGEGHTVYQAFDGQTLLRTQVPFIAQAACTQCIQLTPNTAIPGATISVQGSNFTAGETVNIYFQQASNGIVSATVDGSGTFTAALTATWRPP